MLFATACCISQCIQLSLTYKMFQDLRSHFRSLDHLEQQNYIEQVFLHPNLVNKRLFCFPNFPSLFFCITGICRILGLSPITLSNLQHRLPFVIYFSFSFYLFFSFFLTLKFSAPGRQFFIIHFSGASIIFFYFLVQFQLFLLPIALGFYLIVLLLGLLNV